MASQAMQQRIDTMGAELAMSEIRDRKTVNKQQMKHRAHEIHEQCKIDDAYFSSLNKIQEISNKFVHSQIQ